MALVAPILLVLLAATIDLGRLFYAQITITNAAREGALAAAQDPTKYVPNQNCTPATSTSNRVVCAASKEALSSFVTIAANDIKVVCDGVTVTTPAQVTANCHTGMAHTIVVTVTGQFTLATPLLAVFTGGQTIGISSAATTIPRELPPSPPPAPTPTPTPTPAPTPTPSPTPTPGPTPTPSPTPTPTPTPVCLAPVASFTWTPPVTPRKNDTVQFNDSSSNMTPGQCAASWTWSFGDQSGGSTLQNPQYAYKSRGTYMVTLLVANSAGSSTIAHPITVTN